MTSMPPEQLKLLRSYFTLQCPQRAASTLAADGAPNSAVVLPLCQWQGQWCFLMTRRALHMRTHPGQLSFPGGRIDQGETPWQAALRELSEEISVSAEQVTLWGTLPAINTSTGFIVQPYLVELAADIHVRYQADEVDSVYYVPLRYTLASANWQHEQWQLRGKRQDLYFLAFGQRLIWGASAQMLRQLAKQVAPWPELLP